MARTDTLGNFLTDVCDAVREKTGETGTIKASELDTKISEIQTNGDVEEYMGRTISKGLASSYGYHSGWSLSILKCLEPLTVEGTSTEFMFREYPLETTPELIDTSNVTNMSNMFSRSYLLKRPNVKNFNTSNVTTMASMFETLPYNDQLDLSHFDTSNVTSMSSMFKENLNLTQLNVSNFNTSSVTRMDYMFSGCSSIETLDLHTFTSEQLTTVYRMFYGCSSLKHLDIRGLDFTNITSYADMFTKVPTDCEIIVKDDTAKTWMNTNFSTLTNVKTVAEYEAV